MLTIDLTGRRALVAGVADDGGFGFAIAKSLAQAGASVSVATWPPALNIFRNLLERGKMDESRRLADGNLLEFERIYPLDAAFDTLADAPEDIRSNKRYAGTGDFSIEGMANRIREDFGETPLDIVIHSLANGPEVKRPLLDTSRNGYLTAVGVSAYSFVSMISRLGPMMRPGGSFLSLTYMASERVIRGYGGGMSSAKAALERDTRTPAYAAARSPLDHSRHVPRVPSVSSTEWWITARRIPRCQSPCRPTRSARLQRSSQAISRAASLARSFTWTKGIIRWECRSLPSANKNPPEIRAEGEGETGETGEGSGRILKHR